MMEPYSTQQRVKTTEFFYSAERSIDITQLKYRHHFNSKLAQAAP